MTKIKILGFDGWTGGIEYFQRFFSTLSSEKYEFCLIHYGNLGNDINIKSSFLYNGIQVYDLSKYNNSLQNLIKVEKPDFVIFLSLDAYLHKALNRLCKYYNIVTIHHFHGIKSVMDFNSKSTFRTNPFLRIFILKKVIFSTLYYYLPIYINSLFNTNSSFRDYLSLPLDLYNRLFNITNKIKNKDSVADIYFVFTKSDREFLHKFYPDSITSKIVVIGLIDIYKFKIDISLNNDVNTNSLKDNTTIIYFDTATFHEGFVSIDQYLNHFSETNDYYSKKGYSVKFKLHPSSKIKSVLEYFRKNSLLILNDDELSSELSKAKFCLVEPSSIAPLPGVLKIPILKVQYGIYKSLKHGSILDDYSFCESLYDLNETTNKLDLIISRYTQTDCNTQFVEWQTGILGEMKIRNYEQVISDEIEKLLEKAK